MDYINQLQNWTKGEVLQGKTMLLIAFAILIIIFAIFKSDHSILKGMIVPLSLLLLFNAGYGSYVMTKRPAELKISTAEYQENPIAHVEKALTKAQTDDKTYTMIKKVWAVLLVVSLLAFFFVSKDYFTGFSIGFLVFFSIAILIDTLLHHRLKPILELLNQLSLN